MSDVTPRQYRAVEWQRPGHGWGWCLDTGPPDNPLFLADFYRNEEAAVTAADALSACHALDCPPAELKPRVQRLLAAASEYVAWMEGEGSISTGVTLLNNFRLALAEWGAP